jgi:hypothetical protein
MKFTLTITDATSSELAALLNSVGAVAAGVPFTVTSDDDGDESNAAPVAVTPGTVDSAGLPHDARIHSKAASVNADGTWRKRKGVDQATVTAVEAELRARAGTPAPSPAASAPPPAASAPPPAASAPPPAAAAPPPPPAAAALDFGGLMQIVSNGMTSTPKLIDDATIAWLCAQVGINQLPEIAANPEKIKQVYDLLVQHNRIAK